MKEKLSPENKDISEIRNKVREKYFSGRRPESDFSDMGDIKLIDDKIFFVYKASQQTRQSGWMANSLKVLGNNDLKELFNSGSYMYKEFTNYTDENTAEHNYNKPETEWKEIIGVKDGVVEILNSNDEIITIELPEGILSKEE